MEMGYTRFLSLTTLLVIFFFFFFFFFLSLFVSEARNVGILEPLPASRSDLLGLLNATNNERISLHDGCGGGGGNVGLPGGATHGSGSSVPVVAGGGSGDRSKGNAAAGTGSGLLAITLSFIISGIALLACV